MAPLDENIRMEVLGLDVPSPNIQDVCKDDLSILKKLYKMHISQRLIGQLTAFFIELQTASIVSRHCWPLVPLLVTTSSRGEPMNCISRRLVGW